MYGMVNAAVRGLVKEKFGDEAWHKIHTAADAPESFVAMESYDDDVTYGLVGAAVDVLGLDAPTILQAFGVLGKRRGDGTLRGVDVQDGRDLRGVHQEPRSYAPGDAGDFP